MLPKIKDVNNIGYLTNIYLRMKLILTLWHGLTRTTKLVEYQTAGDYNKFEEKTIELNKALC